MKKTVAITSALLLVAVWFATDSLRSKNSPQPAPPSASASAPSSEKPRSLAPAEKSPGQSGIATADSPPPTTTGTATLQQPVAQQSLVYPQMTLSEVVKPGNVFRDDLFGVSATFPEGWSVKHAVRWGLNNRENTVFFQAPDDSRATPSMYYQKYPAGAPTGVSHEAYLRDLAVKKEASRQKDGLSEYQNDPGSFVYREIGGRPSLSYSATYISKNGEVHAEYFTRILGPGGYVMFFVKGPAADVQKVIPDVYDMSGTVKTP